MRSVKHLVGPLGLGAVLWLSACATSSAWTSGGTLREVEMAHDDGHPSERPILPSGDFELLIKEEPNLAAYRPVRLRFLVAQPGRLLFHLYETGPDGRPGKLIYTLSGVYSPAMTSNGSDGKWVVEALSGLPTLHGPIWLGVGVPDSSSEARVWAAQNDSGHVFQRDTEPQTALMSSPVHYTPMVRLVLEPQ